jgi:hypothetical protein
MWWAGTAVHCSCRCIADEGQRHSRRRSPGKDPVASFPPTAAEVTAASREEGAPSPAVRHPAGARTGAELLGVGCLMSP